MSVKHVDWIKSLRLPLMIGVVFIHTFDPVKSFHGGMASIFGWGSFADYVLFTFSQGFARVSVPAFYMLAGFFFFISVSKNSGVEWWLAIKKRVFTLIIPFLIWNCIVFVIFALSQLIGIRSGGSESRVGDIFTMGGFELIDKIIGVSSYPIAYQFWFIRDLILVCALSLPLVYASKNILAAITFAFVVMWVLGFGIGLIPSMVAIVYFFFGATCARFSSIRSLEKVPKYVFFLYCIIVLSEYFIKDLYFYPHVHRIGLVFGVMSIYWISSLFSKWPAFDKVMCRYASASFFLFAFHEPMLQFVKRIFFSFVQGEISAVVAYFSSVILVTVAALIVFRILQINFPRGLALLVGGR